MKDTNLEELDALIDACLDDRLSEAEADRLSRLIEESSEARERYWELASVHGMVEQSLQSASLKAATGEEFVEPVAPANVGWLFRWPRITAVAAGLVIGIFSASMVWAYAIPREGGITRTSQEIVSEDFEDPEMKVKPHLPVNANQWFGRLVSVAPKDGVSAVQGSRVGLLSPVAGNRAESARYVVDLHDLPELAPGHVRSLVVKASFAAPFTGQEPGFRVGLVAFSQAPEDVRQAWKDRWNSDAMILQGVERKHLPKKDERGKWHEVSASLEIPEGTRSVIVSLGVWHLNPDQPVSDFYLDAVQVQLVDTYEPSPANFASR